jgi:hypothetical protein
MFVAGIEIFFGLVAGALILGCIAQLLCGVFNVAEWWLDLMGKPPKATSSSPQK